MRKKFILYILPLCIFLGAMILGIVKRQTYEDFTNQEGYLIETKVAEFPESLIEETCKSMREELPKSPVILRVEAVGEIEFLHRMCRQKAVVREVYAGNAIETGSEIYIDSGGMSFIYPEYGRSTASDDSGHEMEIRFVNIMRVGDEYLIFVKEVIGESETGIPVVKLNEGYPYGFIDPKFSYKEHRNVIMPVQSKDWTYVDYKDVMDNEFFMTTEKAMEKILELKKELIMMYPTSKTQK